MRLIDADALFREIKNSDWLPHERINAMKMVREQPIIDAVPVVRCKACKHFITFVEPFNKVGTCRRSAGLNPENHFCSCGELKDGGG